MHSACSPQTANYKEHKTEKGIFSLFSVYLLELIGLTSCMVFVNRAVREM